MSKTWITSPRDRRSAKAAALHAQLTSEVIQARAHCEAKNIVLPQSEPAKQPWWVK